MLLGQPSWYTQYAILGTSTAIIKRTHCCVSVARPSIFIQLMAFYIYIVDDVSIHATMQRPNKVYSGLEEEGACFCRISVPISRTTVRLFMYVRASNRCYFWFTLSRKQTRPMLVSVTMSKRLSPCTSASNSFARPTCPRICCWSLSTPQSRNTIHSLIDRKRRPSGICQCCEDHYWNQHLSNNVWHRGTDSGVEKYNGVLNATLCSLVHTYQLFGRT